MCDYRILEEHGIQYSHEEISIKDYLFKKVDFFWKFYNQSGMHTIYMRNPKEIYQLLNVWNSKDSNYKYWL